MSERARGGTWIRVIAEFVVIVIGVLVALAVDNWARQRAERATELEYLESLAEDLRGDARVLGELLLPGVITAQGALDTLAPIVRGRQPVPSDTVGLLRQVNLSVRSFSQLGFQGSFDELQATGALRLLRSAQLRSALVSYYTAKTYARERADRRASGYETLVRRHLPTPIAGDPTEDDLRAFGLHQAVRALQTSEFEHAMNAHFTYIAAVRESLEGLVQDGGHVLELIEVQIANLR